MIAFLSSSLQESHTLFVDGMAEREIDLTSSKNFNLPTVYKINVFAINMVGESPPSNTVAFNNEIQVTELEEGGYLYVIHNYTVFCLFSPHEIEFPIALTIGVSISGFIFLACAVLLIMFLLFGKNLSACMLLFYIPLLCLQFFSKREKPRRVIHATASLSCTDQPTNFLLANLLLLSLINDIYVCMYVCMHVCVCIRVYVCVCVYTCVCDFYFFGDNIIILRRALRGAH